MGDKVTPKKVVFFHAITPVHMGAGQGLDHIDLPIQREQHTKFPIFYASGIKGALRQLALEIAKEKCKGYSLTEINNLVENSECPKEEQNSERNEKQDCEKAIETLVKIFGSQDCKGSLTISDAKILFFSVKSLKGVFAYVTCPYVLNRYGEDTGKGKIFDSEIAEGKIFASETLKVEGSKAVLEEFEFENIGEPKEVIEKLNLPEDLKNKISQRVAIVSDDIFSYFVENLTEVVNRIKIDPETGTVDKKTGGLWTEEYLPAESVLYSLWFENEDLNSAEENYLPSDGSLLILGGDQTVGKGIVKLYEGEV
ncbi:MAG: type III-B CRISPR module RAMP protein Cmr4 [Gammaproteobacteria bacterium]|nr:MAG: type III-B CRISPR module RAMP protein Cmr4 [Gammaproteobacteria bacterium]